MIDYDPELQDEMNEMSSDRKEFLSEMDEEEVDEMSDEFYCPYCRDQNPGCTWCTNYVEY